MGDIDSVNTFSGNLVLTIPVGGSYPITQSFGYGLTLVYNSNVWDFHEVEDPPNEPRTLAVPQLTSNAGLGWMLTPGRLLLVGTPGNDNGCVTYLGPDGGEHVFYPTLHPDGQPGCALDGEGTKFTRDGSYLRLRRVREQGEDLYELDLPSGLIHRFYDDGRLDRVRDRFGNWLDLDYQVQQGRPVWALTDNHGRSHSVHFKYVAYDGTTFELVDYVELAAFGPDPARFDFVYGEATIVRGLPSASSPGQLGCPPPPARPDCKVTVPLLTAVLLADEEPGPAVVRTSYDMPVSDYITDLAPGAGSRSSGAIRGITLPTKGRVEWTYQDYVFPAAGGKRYRETTSGVATRTQFDMPGHAVGTWTYDPELSLGHYSANTVTDPLGNRTKHYFMPVFGDTRYGLPFTLDYSDGSSPGRYLSTQVFSADEEVGLLRSTYVRYESDPLPPPQPSDAPERRALNHRPASSRTVYHDDGNRRVDVDSAEFDGFGHFRKATTSDNFGFGTMRIERTEWSPLVDESKWVLGTYTARQQEEGGGSPAEWAVVTKQEFQFNAFTGFLECQRLLRSGTTRDGHDVVLTYTNVGGEVGEEQWHGGDTATVPEGSVCGSLSTPTYRQCHQYAAGVRNRTDVREPAVACDQGGSTFLRVLDLTIDLDAGLPSASRDAAGRETTFSYNAIGRLLASTPPGGDATTSLTYEWSAIQPPVVHSQLASPGGSPVLEHQRWVLDGLGRMALQQTEQPSGALSGTRVFYNGMGWKTFVSERASSPDLPAPTASLPDCPTARGTSYCRFDPSAAPRSWSRQIVATPGSTTRASAWSSARAGCGMGGATP